MLRKIKEIFKPLPTVEVWALHNANRCTPDDIIAASIVQSFAKDFDKWKFQGEFNQRHDSRLEVNRTALYNEEKNITVLFLFRRITRTNSDGYYVYKFVDVGCRVNGVDMTKDAYLLIRRSWNNMVVKVKAAKAAADEAKRNMEKNEQAWNLAEKLLGMKRNEFGALIPIKTAEHEEPCDDCRSRTVMCRKHQYTAEEKHDAEQQKETDYSGPGSGVGYRTALA